MAMKAGYLMGLFDSETVLLDGEATARTNLMGGTNGVSGQFSNVLSLDWWDQTPGAGSIAWGANYGYNSNSGGCAITATAAVDTEIGQTITLDSALTEVKKFSLSLWAKLATTKEATLTVTFKTAAGATIGTPDVLTITAHNANYGDTNWGYWSVFLDFPVTAKSVEFAIAPTSAQTMYIDKVEAMCLLQVVGAHEQLSIDLVAEREDVSTFKSLQDEKQFRTFFTTLMNGGEITVRNYWGVAKWWDATTAYAAGDVVQHNERSYTCILASTNNEPPNATYWTILGTENMNYTLIQGTKVFCILFTDTGATPLCGAASAIAERYEFWARIPQSGITAPLAGAIQNPFTLAVDGIVGIVDRAKD